MMKNRKNMTGLLKTAAYLFLIVMIFVLGGCGKKADSSNVEPVPETSAFQVQTVTDEKYICAMYPLDENEAAGTVAKIQSVKDESKVYTAEYTENLASFCFLLNETGRYKVSIIRGETVLSEHALDINEESSYYLLYMPGIERGQ